MSAATAPARGSHPTENDDAARPGPSGPVGVPRWIWVLVAAAGAAGLAAAGWLTGVTAARQLSDPGWIPRRAVPGCVTVVIALVCRNSGMENSVATVSVSGRVPPRTHPARSTS